MVKRAVFVMSTPRIVTVTFTVSSILTRPSGPAVAVSTPKTSGARATVLTVIPLLPHGRAADFTSTRMASAAADTAAYSDPPDIPVVGTTTTMRRDPSW